MSFGQPAAHVRFLFAQYIHDQHEQAANARNDPLQRLHNRRGPYGKAGEIPCLEGAPQKGKPHLPFKKELGRPDRDNVIDGYINQNEEDVTAEGNWQKYFTEQPAPFTAEEKAAYLATIDGVALGSDAFFPFSDNIERAKKSGVKYIAEPGGSIRDDAVIECCDKYGMTMAFTGMRLFHH